MSHSSSAATGSNRTPLIIGGVIAAIAVVALVVWFAVGRGGGDSQTPAQAPPGSELSSFAKDGQCTDPQPVKGIAAGNLYFEPTNPKYASTKADYCFASAQAAQQLGFTAGS